jgi:hypothetical protein
MWPATRKVIAATRDGPFREPQAHQPGRTGGAAERYDMFVASASSISGVLTRAWYGERPGLGSRKAGLAFLIQPRFLERRLWPIVFACLLPSEPNFSYPGCSRR